MNLSRREFLRLSGLAAAMTTAGLSVSWSGATSVANSTPELHFLKRMGWGVQPGDFELIRDMGIEAYLERQLNPESDPVTETLLAEEPLLSMSETELRRVAQEDGYGYVFNIAMWARLNRAINSENSLYERMVEFWTDHFNVPIGDLIPEKMVEDREVIRKHALGSFRDLLFASAQSPAMLLYLNNASSHKDHPNENYARELLELHTLGVDGGYSEEDVTNVARAFTGWTLRDGWPGRFFFDSNRHDEAEKVVLGQAMASGRGIEDGLQVLDLLVTHPATANYISLKLCRHFVSDAPPTDLVESTAHVFLNTEGDIRSLLRHILLSDAFLNAEGEKLRRPMDFVVAAVRTLQPALKIEDPKVLLNRLEPMGHLPYMWHPPDGYPDVATAWLNTNGILHRWNFAMLLGRAARGNFERASLDLEQLIPVSEGETVGELIDKSTLRLLGGTIQPEDRESLVFFMSDFGDEHQLVDKPLRAERLPSLIGLLLASPYFQWR